jgi:hypothetical protein
LQAVADVLAKAVNASVPQIRRRVGEWVEKAISECAEYEGLVNGGQLQGELGVINPKPILDLVIHNIVEGIRVTPGPTRIFGDIVEGYLTIELVKGDYSEVLNANGSFQSNGYDIDWLEWLTLEGDRIIISDYHYSARQSKYSRTNQGIMVKTGQWALPAEYAGTAHYNWITRALEFIGKPVEQILVEEIQRNL